MRILKKIFGLAKEKGYDKDAVRSFMDNNRKLEFGKGTISFYDFPELEEAQKGFSRDEYGKSLATDESGSWDKMWLVIGKEDICDDPVFIDTYSEELPVFTAVKEKNQWIPVEIASSLSAFQNIIEKVQHLQNSQNTDQGKDQYMRIVERENKELDNWWWEALL